MTDDVGLRSFLLGDFHVCLAECLGNSLLSDTLRDFTARTTLIAMLYQSTHDAAHSCAEHIMQRHIGNVQDALKLQAPGGDPLDELRQALKPLEDNTVTGSKETVAQPLHTRLPSKPSDDSSTYLRALL
jgi:DNA-binding GntR family transcriptional regulator